MAKNWNVAEAAKMLAGEYNAADIQDMGRRFPLTLNLMARVAAKAGEDFDKLMEAFPEHITARKIESALKQAVVEDVESMIDDEDVPAAVLKAEEKKVTKDKPAPKPKKAKLAKEEEIEEEVDENDYSSMTAPQLFKLAKERGLKPKARQKADHYVDMLLKDDAKDVDEVVEEDDDDDWDI